MALRQLIIGRRMAEIETELQALSEREAAVAERRAAWQTREAAAEEAFGEITAETPEEERAAFEKEAAEIEEQNAAITAEETEMTQARSALESEFAKLKEEQETLKAKAEEGRKAADKGEKREEKSAMITETAKISTRREILAQYVTREDVRGFISDIREKRGLVNGDVTVPTVLLPLLREDVGRYSKLMGHVNVVPVAGNGQQNVIPEVPEAVWTEAEGALNPLTVKFGQFLVGAHKVAGYVAVPNSLLVSSDVDLAGEVIDLMARSIGTACDRAILYGTGSGMPKGIVTRLALSSSPAWWPTKAPAFTDLHTSNIGCLSGSGVTGANLFKEMVAVLGKVKHQYDAARGDLFWAMNRATYLKLVTELISITAAGTIATGIVREMPVIGGAIEIVDFMPDNVVVGGYGDQYLMPEREGLSLRGSSDAMFIEDNTVYAASALYDGIPVAGEGFAMFTLATSSGATTSTFPTDYANTAIGALTVTTAAHGSTSGKSVITISGAEGSGTTLGYIVGGAPIPVSSGDAKTAAYASISTGDAITAATGKYITVVEFDGNDRAIKVGSAVITAKA